MYILQKHNLEHGCSKDVAKTTQHEQKINPHVIEDINHKNINSHAEKMLEILANEKMHTKLDSEKTLKRTRGKPSAGMYMKHTIYRKEKTCALPIHTGFL